MNKTSVQRSARPSHVPGDLHNRHAAVLGRTSAAAVSHAAGSYTRLANGVARMDHSSQHSTLSPGTPAQLQPTENGHQNYPGDVQNSGNANTKTGKPRCTYCHKPNHTEDDCWTKDPSKKPKKSQMQQTPDPQQAPRSEERGFLPQDHPHRYGRCDSWRPDC